MTVATAKIARRRLMNECKGLFVCLFRTPDGKGRKESDVLYEKRMEVIFSYLYMGQDNIRLTA